MDYSIEYGVDIRVLCVQRESIEMIEVLCYGWVNMDQISKYELKSWVWSRCVKREPIEMIEVPLYGWVNID